MAKIIDYNSKCFKLIAQNSVVVYKTVEKNNCGSSCGSHR